MSFKTIIRAKKIPQASIKAGLITEITGDNRLEVKNEGAAAEMHLCGSVGSSWYDEGGITEAEVKSALAEIPKGKKINVHINSEGGSVQEGLGIYNAFKARSKDITAHIDGYALSIASVFPLAASKVISPKSAIWMIHQASCGCYGNAEDTEKTTKMLREHDDMLSEIYAAETGKGTAESWLADMKAETWKRGSEAVEYGLADESDEADASNAYKPMPRAWLDRCKNIPANILNILAVANRDTQTTQPAASTAINSAAPTAVSINTPVTATVTNSAAPKSAGNQNQPNKTMNKEKIVALLKAHGIEAKADWTDEQFETALTNLAKTNNAAKLEAIEAKLELAETRRITDKVRTYVAAQKITNAEVSIFVAAMKNDEAATVKILNEKEVAFAGGDPVGFNRIEGGDYSVLAGYQGRPTEMVANVFKAHTTPEARYEAFKLEFPKMHLDAISKDKRSGVRNENSFAAGITTNFLIMGAITKLGPQVAALKSFSRDNSVDPYKPLATGVQKFNTTVQDGSDTLTNATDFSSGGDSTMTGPTIAVNQYTQTMHLTNAQLNSGVRMADLIEAKLGSFKSKIAQIVTAPITNANFGGQAPLVINSGAFGFSDLATLQGQLKKSNIKNAILDGEYIARITNTPTFFQQAGTVGGLEQAWKAFGWDLLALHTEWTGADAYVRGFACNPQAIGVVAGLPLNPVEGIPGNIIQVGTAVLPGVDIAIATYLWMDANARTMRATYDIMLGATAVDTTAGIIIKSQ